MKKNNNEGQTIGGSADILARMSKEGLIKLLYDTYKKLEDINPNVDYESYALYGTLFYNIVVAYCTDDECISNE